MSARREGGAEVEPLGQSGVEIKSADVRRGVELGYAQLVTDERLEAALARTDVTPEFVEWHGNPEGRITLRIETMIGRYAECWLTPWMDDDQLVYHIERTAQQLRMEAS